MKALIAVLTCAILFLATPALADTHYISKTGSDTPPYTSWATATDSVLLAIDAASEGDTVRFGPGLFTADAVTLKDRLALIGSGMDSTRILHTGPSYHLIVMGDSCLIQGFHLCGIAEKTPGGIESYALMYAVRARQRTAGLIAYNRITAARYAIWIDGDGGIPGGFPLGVRIENNVLDSFEVGVNQFGAQSSIRNNYILNRFAGWGRGVRHMYGGDAIIEGNYFFLDHTISSAVELELCDSIVVRNNICIGGPDYTGSVIKVSGHDSCHWHVTRGAILNNLLDGGRYAINAWDCYYLKVSNNIITGCQWRDLTLDQRDSVNVGFNLFWDNLNRYNPVDTAERIGRGSIFSDPMFVDSLDFHLQAFSPAIDAGDTLLQDPDGSRSDIGPYGGPLGETYAYVDLPPKVPTLDHGPSLPDGFALIWTGNHEADFNRYELERSPIPEVVGDSGVVIATQSQADTSFVDTTTPASGTWYYRVRAFDNQGNASGYSNELGAVVAGIGDEDATLPERFTLHPNYPNPFNASTRITYSIAAPSEVTLAIYDVLGRHVTTLVRGAQQAGEHSERWDGKDSGGRDVASGVYLLRLSVGDEAQTRKVLLLK